MSGVEKTSVFLVLTSPKSLPQHLTNVSIGSSAHPCFIGLRPECQSSQIDVCCQLFGDINDDVGQSKQNGETTRVQSLAVGEARQGLERFVGSTFHEFS